MTERVGYGHPPAASRWKKGQSGNPSGRKKGSPNLATDLVAELSEIIQINEGGSPRKITKQRALLKSLAARGIQGDAKAANLILGLMMKLLEPDRSAEAAPVDLSANDEAILEAYLRRAQNPQGEG
jgi:hypothetical protein